MHKQISYSEYLFNLTHWINSTMALQTAGGQQIGYVPRKSTGYFELEVSCDMYIVCLYIHMFVYMYIYMYVYMLWHRVTMIMLM